MTEREQIVAAVAELTKVLNGYLDATSQLEVHPVLPYMQDSAQRRAELEVAYRNIRESISPLSAHMQQGLNQIQDMLDHLEQFRDQVPGVRSVN